MRSAEDGGGKPGAAELRRGARSGAAQPAWSGVRSAARVNFSSLSIGFDMLKTVPPTQGYAPKRRPSPEREGLLAGVRAPEHPPDPGWCAVPGRSRRVASISALTSIGALVGTDIAGIAYDVQPIHWAAGSLLVFSALLVPVQELRGNSPARKTSLSRPLAAAAAVAAVAVTTAPRFAPIVIAAALSPAWVGPVATPPLVGRIDDWSLAKIIVLAAIAGGIWFVAPYGVLVLVAWVLSNVIGGVVDAQLDTRNAHGSDPAATAARMRTLQSGVGAADGVGASYLLAETSVAWLALPSALFAFSGAAVLLVIDRRRR